MTTAVLDARDLLEPDAFDDITATVLAANPGMDKDTAQRILTDALAFVAVAARHPYTYIAPSRTVDEGWHALILHTAVYAKLCIKLGRFVHHCPERPDPSRHDDGVMEKTLTLIRLDGHHPHPDLWMPPGDSGITVAAECSHLPRPGGCGPIQPIPKPKPKPNG